MEIRKGGGEGGRGWCKCVSLRHVIAKQYDLNNVHINTIGPIPGRGNQLNRGRHRRILIR